MRYTVILQPETEGYSVICPVLPGCASAGDTLPDALRMITEAAELWLEVWLERGHQIPEETAQAVATELQACILDRAEAGLSLLVETREIEVSLPVLA